MHRRAARTKGDIREVGVGQLIVEVNGKFINSNNKEIGREGAALADGTLGEKLSVGSPLTWIEKVGVEMQD
jgi:hypothetical protein